MGTRLLWRLSDLTLSVTGKVVIVTRGNNLTVLKRFAVCGSFIHKRCFRTSGNGLFSSEHHEPALQTDEYYSASPKTRSTTGKSHNVEDVLFDMFKNEDEKVPVGRFLAELSKTGLRKSDPRLKECMQHFQTVQRSIAVDFSSADGLYVNRETFRECVTDNVVLINRAFRNQLVIPEFKEFNEHVDELYWKCRPNSVGKVADYIPQLARFSPDYWGVSLCTVDGQRYSIGDCQVPFCLQSTCKPLKYAIALDDLGSETVHQYVGQEPSGRIFNELVLDHQNKPHNPMINAGAILITSLVQRHLKLADRFDYVYNQFKRLTGGEYVGFSNATFLSERETADRNYALGYFMRENKCFPEGTNLHETLDFYFQLCAVEVTADSASVMAATFANGGICPITGERIFSSAAVRDVLSLMYSCGMYDYSGQFAFKVGLPAKSGVSGAMLLVVPNVMGLALWSPPLDKTGNTVRGVQFCEEMVKRFNFHNYDSLKHTTTKLDPRKRTVESKGQQVVNLLFSAANGDVTAMRRYFLSGLDMSICDYDGRTALHLAAAEGHLEVVKFLLDKCRVPHSPKDRWEHTPIEDAKRFGHHETVQFLEEWSNFLKDEEKERDVSQIV